MAKKFFPINFVIFPANYLTKTVPYCDNKPNL